MQLNFQLKKPQAEIFTYLTDMDKFVQVHPVIAKMKSIGKDRYIAFETLKLGIIPFAFRYQVQILSNQSDAVTMIAKVWKMTKIEMNYKLSSKNGITSVNENIKIRTLFPLKYLIQKVFKTQHKVLFQNIEAA